MTASILLGCLAALSSAGWLTTVVLFRNERMSLVRLLTSRSGFETAAIERAVRSKPNDRKPEPVPHVGDMP